MRDVRTLLRDRLTAAMTATGQLHALRASRDPRVGVRSWIAGRPVEGASGLCLFSHWDPHGLVDPYVQQAVRTYAESGFDVIFCTTVEDLKPSSVEFLRRSCRDTVHLRNVGKDFAAWRTALLTNPGRPLNDYSEAILVNDSIYTDAARLPGVIDAARRSSYDVYGLLPSWQRGFHLQSFFTWYGPSALDPMARFLDAYFPTAIRNGIVTNGELRLTPYLLSRELSVGTLADLAAVEAAYAEAESRCPIDVRALWAQAKQNGSATGEEPPESDQQIRTLLASMSVNPSHVYWRTLWADLDFPFIKMEVVRRNPLRLPSAMRWMDHVEPGPFRDVVAAHLRRTSNQGWRSVR